MNIRFYMFGVPDGFDIYQEMPNSEIKNYYQCFYDETIKESTRLAIHRKPNGDVSYTYLKYHLFSEGDRPNSFIGLSVVFSGGYYVDVASLYNLLEHAYNGALNKGVILRPTKNKESAVFQTKRFEFEASEVKRIESLVLNTLSSEEYASEFMTWDNGFSSGKQNALLKIPFQIYDDDPDKENELNKFIGQRLKEYSWLSLSPDYIVKASHSPSSTKGKTISDVDLEEVLDPETKKEYKNDFEEYQKNVISVFNEFVSKANDNLNEKVHELSTRIHGILLLLNKYVEKESELNELLGKYADLSKQLETLINELARKASNSSNLPPKSVQTESIQFDDAQYREAAKDNSKQKGGKWKWISVAGGALLLVACYACFLHPIIFPVEPDDNNTDSTGVKIANAGTEMEDGIEGKKTEMPQLEELVVEFYKALQNNDFETAGKCYANVVNQERAGTLGKNMYDALEQKFNNLISECDFESANKMLKECLSKIYENSSINESELKNSFKSYVKANRKSFEKKNELIEQIDKAKNGGYGYQEIDSDLAEINRLSARTPMEQPLKNYTLYVYKDNSNVPEHKSSNDTIVLECNIVYRIRVADDYRVSDAKIFVSEEQSRIYEAWHGDSKKFRFADHQVLLKSRNEAETEFPYKQNDRTLFILKVRFVKPQTELEKKGLVRFNNNK